MTDSSSLLHRNLQALERTDPVAAEEMRCYSAEPGTIRLDQETPGTEWTVCEKTMRGEWAAVHGTSPEGAHTGVLTRNLLASFESGSWITVTFGLGLGYAVRQAAEALERKQPGFASGLLVIEPRTALLRAALETVDLTDLFGHPRVLMALGSRALERCERILEEEGLFVFPNRHAAFRPGCGIVSLTESGWVDLARRRILGFLQHRQEAFARQFQAAQSKYSATAAPRHWPGTVWAHRTREPGAGHVTPLMVEGMLEGFRDCGWRVSVLDVERKRFPLLYQAARHFHQRLPDVIFSLNSSSSRIARFADSYDLPRAVWLVDHPALQSFERPYHPRDAVFAVHEKFVEPGLRAGPQFRGVLHSAAGKDTLPGRRQERFACPVSYVGSLPDVEPLRTELPPALHGYLQEVADCLLRDTIDGFNLFEACPPPIGAEKTKEILRAIPYAAETMRKWDIAPSRAPERFVLHAAYLLANFRKRTEQVRRLLLVGCRMYGPETWKTFLREEGREDLYGGPIRSPDDLADLTASSAVNLCINSAQPGCFINTRVFTVPLLGGFLLTEYSPRMDDVFRDGVNAAWYEHADRLEDTVREYLDSPQKRQSVLEAAQEEIRQNHTWGHRAQSLIDRLNLPES